VRAKERPKKQPFEGRMKRPSRGKSAEEMARMRAVRAEKRAAGEGGAKVDRGFFADGICSHCSRRNPGVLAPGAQPSRRSERASVEDAQIDPPRRRGGPVVRTG
jgi:hypothetical protein